MTHPLAPFAVAAPACSTGATTEAKDVVKRNQYSHTGTEACRFFPLSHEPNGRTGPEAFALINEIADNAAGIEFVFKQLSVENAMRDLATTLRWGFAR